MRRCSILLEKLNENLNHSDKPIKTTTIEKKKECRTTGNFMYCWWIVKWCNQRKDYGVSSVSSSVHF